VVLDKDAGSWFIEDSSNTVIVSVMVEEKGRQTADKKKGRKPWTTKEFGGQTVWDWLHLLSALAIPVVLAAAGLWFTAQQDQRQVAIEEQRAEAERELAEQRAQEEALQAYLNQISQLLLEKGLRDSKEGDTIFTLAQARTSTVILRLDAEHNASVIRFIRDSGLAWSASARRENDIIRGGPAAVDTRPPPASVSLLSGIALNRADLSGADLSWADLSNADLSRADLSRAGLSNANLQEANLSGANLRDANLSAADLRLADLSDADLTDAHINERQLLTADFPRIPLNLEGATMPNGQKYEDWLKNKIKGEK
jgi:Pentapeptide repeats (8 copies)